MKAKKTKTVPVHEQEPGMPARKGRMRKTDYKPSEQEIRFKAEEIYMRRAELGEFGTAEGDWYAAEEILEASC